MRKMLIVTWKINRNKIQMQIQVLAFNGIYEKDADKHES